jgi:hypothetical protein
MLKLGCQVTSASGRDTTHTQGFSNPHYSFPSKKVKKVGGYPIEKTPQSQELPPPSLEMPTILASARGHGVLAFAKVVSTSNIGLESKGPPPWRDGYLRTAEKSIHGFYIPLYGSGFIFDSVLEIWGVDELDRKLRYSSRGQKTIADSPKVTISVSSEGSS